MPARQAMTMRARVERGERVPEKDPHGQPKPPEFVSAAEVPCRVWVRNARHVRTDGKIVTIEDFRGIAPRDADLKIGDQLTVTNRLGAVIYDGPIAIETIVRKSDHLELMFTRH